MQQQNAIPSPKDLWTAHRSPGTTSVSSRLNEADFRSLRPPQDVIWLGRKGGVFWDPHGADQFAHSLGIAALGFEPGRRYLDFGCSSGRTVRTFAAAFTESEWHGCDPISRPVEWARSAMPHISFSNSPETPPTHVADNSFAGVYAASVWSHFAKDAALEWLAEMHRILEPGGWLAFSTHGAATIRHRLTRDPSRSAELHQLWHSMQVEGFVFVPARQGQVHRDLDTSRWGFAFMLADWVAASIAPRWALLVYDPARYGNHQDIYVLQKR
jgi:ubiquinone/menaquinone biosynthesis C-methylase UbiE